MEPFWPGLFAKALSKVNIVSLICYIGAGGPEPLCASSHGSAAGAYIAADAEEKPEVEEEPEESWALSSSTLKPIQDHHMDRKRKLVAWLAH
ncbi:large ribosomal subunit protein P1-like [Narcine bancroftii]|uniref:large ribosomal subunit protein P1-like n=1 Tax=Narcine bancroftii TaxID=1343680 RepID=UPI00383147ED